MSITTLTAQLTDMAVGGSQRFGELNCVRETEDTWRLYFLGLSDRPKSLQEAAKEIQAELRHETEDYNHEYDPDEFGGVGWPE